MANTKYIFVTGGVVSSLGKGIVSASLGKLLQARGYRVTIQKFDPYINVDPGTLNPYEHGECFVTVVDRFSLLPVAGVPMRFDLVLLIGSYAVLLLGIHAATRGSRRTLFAFFGGTLSLIVYTLAQHQFGG